MKTIALTILFSAALLSACTAGRPSGPDEPLYRLPVGTALELPRDLEIPVGWARVYIQNGKVTRAGDIARYYPHCNLEVTEVTPPIGEPQWVSVGRFAITRMLRRPETISGGGFNPKTGYSEGSPIVEPRTVFVLRSDTQPGVRRLTCTQWSDRFYDYLSLNEIRATLGGLIRIK